MMYGFPIFAAGGALSFLVGFWLHYQLAKHKDVELDIFGGMLGVFAWLIFYAWVFIS
jgi:hypothetical protein